MNLDGCCFVLGGDLVGYEFHFVLKEIRLDFMGMSDSSS